MEKEQEMEWAEAQKIAVSVDLVSAAKNQLKFLAAVDRNRCLYEGPAMEWAIYRYNAYWLPLLAKHLEKPVSDGPLVVPLDCEWIWHCHRLNPVRYKSDCEKLFGRILGNHNIVSSVQGTSKSETEEIWSTMYPEEPYEFDHNRPFPDVSQKNVQTENFTSYDLISAVKRQVSFCYQVSRPHVSDDLFLQEALARYKGFLHLIRTNRKKRAQCFCVPTYDVDLMWHSHQLHPVSYCNDLNKLLGKVLEHDDTDSDRTKGKKLDTGFSTTTKLWAETFGMSYWKAGAMYRGNTPTPVTQIPFPFIYEGKAPENCSDLIQLPEMKAMEVFLEFVEIKNLPEGHKGNLRVSFSKKQPDRLFTAKRTLTILSESGEKQVAYFQCEPTGELLFELLCHFPSNIPLPKSFKPLGSCSLSFQECLASGSKLFVDKWLPVVPVHGILASKPILLHVSLSFTPPTPAPQVFHLVQPQPFLGSCFIPLPKIGKVKNAKGQAYVIDDDGNDVLSLQMRDFSKNSTRSIPDLLKEVLYITDSGETQTLAEFQGNEWVIKGSHGSLKLHCTSGNDGYFYELVGHKMMRLFAGRKLDYEPKHCEKQGSEQDFMTAVEFSAEFPYGRAVALVDFKHGILQVMDEWMIQIGITLAFILSDILRREGRFTAKVGCEGNIPEQVTNSPSPAENKTVAQVGVANNDAQNAKQGRSQSGACGGNCGSGCGIAVESGGLCGGGYCGGNCGGGGCLTAKVDCKDNIQNQVTNSPSLAENLTVAQVVVANNDAGNAKQGLSQSGSCGSGCGYAVDGGGYCSGGACGGDCATGSRCFTAKVGCAPEKLTEAQVVVANNDAKQGVSQGGRCFSGYGSGGANAVGSGGNCTGGSCGCDCAAAGRCLTGKVGCAQENFGMADCAQCFSCGVERSESGGCGGSCVDMANVGGCNRSSGNMAKSVECGDIAKYGGGSCGGGCGYMVK